MSESGDLIEDVFRIFPDGIMVTDTWGAIIKANNAAQKILGIDMQHILGRHLAELLPELMIEKKSDEEIKRMFMGLSDEGFVENFETAFIHADGKVCHVELNVSLLKDTNDQVTGTVVKIRDISERIEMEQEMLRAKRIESISALAEGIANDFNTIFTSILGNITLAQSSVSLPDEIAGYLDKAEKDSLRAKDLIEQLMAFAGGNKLRKIPLSIVGLLTEAAHQTLQGSKTKCEFSFGSDVWNTLVDRDKISQVFKGLIINAERSMPEGGCLHISVENFAYTSVSDLPLKEGLYVKITIRDQGIGILNEYIQDIFDPYFKQGRKRSGFVLATAYAAIKRHDGLINVESEFGSGTTFNIYLPAQEDN